jgi:putative hemolysin
MSELTTQRSDVFHLPLTGRIPVWSSVARRLRGPLERVLALDSLGRDYAALPQTASVDDFLAAVLGRLGVSWRVRESDLARIPRTGPVVVVANHPYGGVEGLILGAILHRLRPDTRIMANALLGRIPELHELLVLVDPFGGPGATASSFSGLREAARVLSAGGLLLVFPAGEVAALDLRAREVRDPAWSDTAARLALRSAATVVPVYFEGCNAASFQIAGLFHPRLRTALLARALVDKRRRPFVAHVAEPMSAAALRTLGEPAQVTAYLRERTFNLARRSQASRPAQSMASAPVAPVPIAAAVPIARLVSEVEGLSPDQVLVEAGEMIVLVARSHEIPAVLEEVGRLREETFRAAGEGTGKTSDLDEFDVDYRHLVVWNRQERHVVGAYRLGLSDSILLCRGVAGLYTSTLFDFDPRFFALLGPALELGRSFVRREYQRAHLPLALLWRGIGQFVAQNPRYRYLFGPVSVAASYEPRSRHLLASFLRTSGAFHPWSRMVRPRNPLRVPLRHAARDGKIREVVPDIEQLSPFIADIERDGKGLPILVKQYFRLGARVLGLNVDRDFSDVLDLLVLVDLTATEPRTLERYMGKAHAAAFRARHGAIAAPRPGTPRARVSA